MIRADFLKCLLALLLAPLARFLPKRREPNLWDGPIDPSANWFKDEVTYPASTFQEGYRSPRLLYCRPEDAELYKKIIEASRPCHSA